MEGGWKQVLFLFWYRSSMKRKKYKCAENFSTLLMVEGIVSGERISLKRSVSERYRITLVTVARDTFFCVYFNSMFGGDGSRLVGPRQACLNFTRILSSISTKPDYIYYIYIQKISKTYVDYKNLFSIWKRGDVLANKILQLRRFFNVFLDKILQLHYLQCWYFAGIKRKI